MRFIIQGCWIFPVMMPLCVAAGTAPASAQPAAAPAERVLWTGTTTFSAYGFVRHDEAAGASIELISQPVTVTRTANDESPFTVVSSEDGADNIGRHVRGELWTAALVAGLERNDDLAGMRLEIRAARRIDSSGMTAWYAAALLCAMDRKPLPDDVAIAGGLLYDGTLLPVAHPDDIARAAEAAGKRRLYIAAEQPALAPLAAATHLQVITVTNLHELMNSLFGQHVGWITRQTVPAEVLQASRDWDVKDYHRCMDAGDRRFAKFNTRDQILIITEFWFEDRLIAQRAFAAGHVDVAESYASYWERRLRSCELGLEFANTFRGRGDIELAGISLNTADEILRQAGSGSDRVRTLRASVSRHQSQLLLSHAAIIDSLRDGVDYRAERLRAAIKVRTAAAGPSTRPATTRPTTGPATLPSTMPAARADIPQLAQDLMRTAFYLQLKIEEYPGIVAELAPFLRAAPEPSDSACLSVDWFLLAADTATEENLDLMILEMLPDVRSDVLWDDERIAREKRRYPSDRGVRNHCARVHHVRRELLEDAATGMRIKDPWFSVLMARDEAVAAGKMQGVLIRHALHQFGNLTAEERLKWLNYHFAITHESAVREMAECNRRGLDVGLPADFLDEAEFDHGDKPDDEDSQIDAIASCYTAYLDAKCELMLYRR